MSKVEIRIDAVSDGNIPHITGQSKIERNRITMYCRSVHN